MDYENLRRRLISKVFFKMIWLKARDNFNPFADKIIEEIRCFSLYDSIF